MQLTREVHRHTLGDWIVREDRGSRIVKHYYTCEDEMAHYFNIPKKATVAWITLSTVPVRPAPNWIKLRVREPSTPFVRAYLSVEPRPGEKNRHWRRMPMYRLFNEDINNVLLGRPGGGDWCWMQVEYKTT